MPIERDIAPDFQSDAICKYLCLGDGISSNREQACAGPLQAGYDDPGIGDKLVATKKLALPTFRTTPYGVFTRVHRLIRTVSITDPIFNDIEMSVKAVLLIKTGLPQQSATALINAFNKADPADTNKIETDLIKSGANVDDYYVVLYFSLKNGKRQLDETNTKAFVDQVGAELAADGKPLYIVDQMGQPTVSCSAPDNVFDDHDVTIVKDVDNPLPDILKQANDEHQDCDGLELTDHRIGTAFQHYEWKIEWEVRPIKIGPCEIMRTKIPIVYSRIRKYALWGVAMTRPQIKDNFEKAIVTCLIGAAVSTAALAIVTGGLGVAAAAAAFGSAVYGCIETKIEDAVKCFFVTLKLVTEYGDWEEKVF